MPTDNKPEDPLKEYNEWIRNRYNPGYYLGGRLPPMIRAYQAVLSAKEKRVALFFIVLGCIVLPIAWCVRTLLWPPQ